MIYRDGPIGEADKIDKYKWDDTLRGMHSSIEC